jgi:hypothetical protein
MNDWIMKAEYIQPETLIIEITGDTGAIICASGKSLINDPTIIGREYEED